MDPTDASERGVRPPYANEGPDLHIYTDLRGFGANERRGSGQTDSIGSN